MLVLKCDCNGCNNVANKLNSITLTSIDGTTSSYAVCNECLRKVQDFFTYKAEEKAEKSKEFESVVKPKKEKSAKKESTTSEVSKKAPMKKGEATKLIDEYGRDKVIEEYLEHRKSARVIAEKIGVTASALNMYLARLGVHKRGSNKEEVTSSDSSEGN